MKKSSRCRTPDAERERGAATVVVRVSSPSSPEAVAAPRRPLVSQPASDGSLAAFCSQEAVLACFCIPTDQTLTVAHSRPVSVRLSRCGERAGSSGLAPLPEEGFASGHHFALREAPKSSTGVKPLPKKGGWRGAI